MLGIEFAMLIIDLSISNLPLCFCVVFMLASPLGIDSSLMITGGNFLMSPPFHAPNAMGNLVGSRPHMVNETILTLEHVMERLDDIEKKMLTEDHMEIIHKKMHNFATNLGSKRAMFLNC